MKYLKLYEAFTKDVDATEYFYEVEDLLKHKNKNSELTIKDGKLLYDNRLEIKVDSIGNVKMCKGVIQTIIGRILINDDSGTNPHTYNNVYDDGTPIKLGDDVIVNTYPDAKLSHRHIEGELEFQGVVDGFSSDMVMVEDQEGNIFYVPPTSLERT